MRVGSRVLVVVLVVAALGALAPLAASSAGTSQQKPSQRVIIVLRDQDRAQPATRAMLARRRHALAVSQAPVRTQLSRAHARRVHAYTILNAVSATVTAGEAAALRRDPAVKEVVPDVAVHLSPPSVSGGGSGAAGGTTPVPGACGRDGRPQLEPEALQTMSVDSTDPRARTARSLGFTGAGVKVGFIADALDINNPDFIRADGQHVFVDYKDFSGFGTSAPTAGAESFGDASSIGAQGRQVYDVSHFSALPLDRPCNIRIEGVAPGADLVGLVAFGASDVAPDSSILEAIDYGISTAHVNVLNESFGINNYPDDGGALDLIAQANDQAVAAGITVTESTGDAGPTNTTGEAATDPNVISAGASTTYRFDVQAGYGGARFPGVTGWLSDNISSLDSAGIDQHGRTLDVVAPGEDNWALCSTNTDEYQACSDLTGNPSPVELFGGTSESAPLTAGVAALVIQAYESTHYGTPPSPALVKQFIVSTTDDVGAPAEQQGSGRVDAYKAVLAAEHYNNGGLWSRSSRRTDRTPVVTTSPTQLNASDAPGTPETLTDTITNASGRSQHLALGSRTLGAYRLLTTTTVSLSDSGPQTEDYTGATDNYQKVTFNVPAGQDRLSASAAFHNAQAPSLNARVRITLVDPKGRLAAYSVPQGLGNYGNVQVTAPRRGTWTAYIWSHNSASGGTIGPVLFGAAVARYTSFGHVSPSRVTLAPGESTTVRLMTATPSQPGDTAGAIVVWSRSSGFEPPATTIPVTLRSLIQPGSQSFAGTLTGGNGRSQISGQEFFYQLDLPAGRPELNATVTLADNPNNQLGAYLVDPQGEAVAYASNMVPGASASAPPNNLGGAQLHTLNPVAGRWTLIVVFAPAVSGDALSEPFRVTVDQQTVPASGGGLPDAAATQLTAGQPHTYNVTVKNTGTAPETFFADARLPGSTTFALGAVSGASAPLPANSNLPVYLVPTNSTQFNAQATTDGATPIQFESQPAGGDPDLESSTGQTAGLTVSGNPITQGEWDVLPIESGTFGATGPPPETAATSASVITSPFDPAVTAPTGDLEADSANPATSLGTFAPITVDPGQTGTIPITVTPNGPSGTHVTGTLYLDDTAYFEFGSIQNALVNYPQADEVAAIPYAYTIK